MKEFINKHKDFLLALLITLNIAVWFRDFNIVNAISLSSLINVYIIIIISFSLGIFGIFFSQKEIIRRLFSTEHTETIFTCFYTPIVTSLFGLILLVFSKQIESAIPQVALAHSFLFLYTIISLVLALNLIPRFMIGALRKGLDKT